MLDYKKAQATSIAQFKSVVLADSVNMAGERLTTFELTYPRPIHSELMTHRLFSRNAASSRAIPVERLLKALQDTPYVPHHLGVEQSGMQAGAPLSDEDAAACIEEWFVMRDACMAGAARLRGLRLHKQIANRPLEPWMFITVIMSTTSFRHFELLRNHSAAEPHFQHLARLMCASREASIPKLLQAGEWHMPLMYPEDAVLSLEDQKKVSTARCAAVSYVRHAAKKEHLRDITLHDSLAANKHLSPFEHVATPTPGEHHGNFKGWRQHRQDISGEFVPDDPYDISNLFPDAAGHGAAFLDYRVNAMSLTALDIQVASAVVFYNMSPDHDRLHYVPADEWDGWPEDWRDKTRCRERDECVAKLKRLGMFQ